VKIGELCAFLVKVSDLVDLVGKKSAADGLRQFVAGLEPFQAWDVSRLMTFLHQCDEYQRTGQVSAGRRGTGKAKVRQEVVDRWKNRLEAFYERVIQPEVTYESIEAELERLNKECNKEEALAIAQALNIATSSKTKKGIVEVLRQRFAARKSSYERTDF